MSLKCSIFGHRWGERTVEREREEQGSEVVSTEREIQTCQHCGDRRVVSENTEVTTLESPEETAGTSDAETTASATTPGAVAGSARGEHGDSATDAEVIDADPADEASAEAASTATATRDDEGGTTGAERGAGTTQPSGDGDTDDGVILDESAPRERQPGEWPEDADEATEPEWARQSSATAGGQDDPEYEATGPTVTVPEGQFYCPACGFATAVESSSLRAGDFCPECQEGSLEHHADAD